MLFGHKVNFAGRTNRRPDNGFRELNTYRKMDERVVIQSERLKMNILISLKKVHKKKQHTAVSSFPK